MTHWNGRYYVTLLLPNGRIRRQDATRALPQGNVSVLATDNGMQDRDCYRKQLAALRTEHRLPSEGQS